MSVFHLIHFRHGEMDRRDDYDRFPAPYRPPEGPSLTQELEELNRENLDLRRMMGEDAARAKADVESLQLENRQLQENIDYLKNTPDSTQTSSLRQENEELNKKLKSVNEWYADVQSKFGPLRRESDSLRENIKVLDMELKKLRDEKDQQKRQVEDLETKLQMANKSKADGGLAVEKKEYLETKVNRNSLLMW